MTLTIRRQGSPVVLEYSQPTLLSSLLSKTNCPVEMPCGGRQTCLKCKVTATGGLTPPGDRERSLLSAEELAAGIRFACMATAAGDVEVIPRGQAGAMSVLAGGDLAVRPQPWEGVRPGGLGAAVDIGTTTVAAGLYRLEDGALMKTATARNPQAAFGADVITRIGRAMQGESEALATAVRNCVRGLLTDMAAAGRPEAVSITGNTAMLYLLCGYDPSAIAAAPFIPDHIFGEYVDPQRVGLEGLADRVYLTRCMSAYVGGDITTAVLAGDVHLAGKPTMLVDIGTNGEMALNTGSRLLVCSTAAGPAFEGAGIAMGLPAVPGAISAVRMQDHTIYCETIGGADSRGICGSGILDAVAALLEAGVLDESGRLEEDGHAFAGCMTELDGVAAFRLPGTDVMITQKDIRAVQLGKSAICAGLLTLLDTAGLAAADIDRLLIAGGFGSFLNIQSAARIGLIPPELADRSVVVGNAAATGAAMVLVSRAALTESEALAGRAETIELSTSSMFMEQYVEQMLF